MKTVCCICHKTKRGNAWIKGKTNGEKLSHGYCPSCFKKAMKNFQFNFLHPAGKAAF